MSAELQADKRKRLGLGATLVLLLLLLLLFAGFITYRLEVTGSRLLSASTAEVRALAGKTRDAFIAIAQLQPKVTVNEEVIFTQATPVLELAVLNRPVLVERETSASWLGSTKRLRLRGIYNVKAGYDLRQPFAVHLDSEHPYKIAIALPRAKILSVEQTKLDVLTLENGVWNRINAADVSSEVNELNLDARKKAVEAGVAAQAASSFTTQLKDKLGPMYEVDVSANAGEPLLAPK